MARGTSRLAGSLAAIVRPLVRLYADRRGNIAVMMALALPALVGAMGLGFEVSNWYMTKRAMQNAADAAVIAAATNGGSNYDVQAKAVTAQSGYIAGSKNITP